MAIKLGMIEYQRPSRPVKADDIRQFLAVGGKDIVRIAWSSLAPGSDNEIKHEALAVWMCEFFNLRRKDGQGSKCIRLLCDMNILYRHGNWVRPEFDT